MSYQLDIAGAIVGGVSLLTLCISVGIRWGQRQSKDKAQDEAQRRADIQQSKLVDKISSLASTLDRVDERQIETLRQVSKFHERLDKQEAHAQEMDRRIFAHDEILKWLRSSAKFKLPTMQKEDE